uniref:Uncharacterized protein n=1 Tax=Sinocyclocheilus anshuiensis TaxID=1608454 RepID=A0A671PY87_9TELE
MRSYRKAITSSRAKAKPHAGSPLWILWCRFSSPERKKFLPHCVQWKGLSPVWMLWWPLSRSSREKLLSCPDSEKLFPSPDVGKFLPHWKQGKGRSPLWMRWCRLMSLIRKYLPQSWQWYGRSAEGRLWVWAGSERDRLLGFDPLQQAVRHSPVCCCRC